MIPGYAAALVAAGRLDERLFDVTSLLEYGYDDTRHATLPLIVQYEGAAPRSKVAGVATVRQLPSVHGAAITVPKKAASAWWKTVVRQGGGTPQLQSSYATIWLTEQPAGRASL